MTHLKHGATLGDVQAYIREMEVERGFDKTCSNIQSALQLGEEVGELFKSIRKAERMRVDTTAEVSSIEEELADVLIFVASLANRYGIDLEDAFRNKEAINNSRTWE
jgi:NTP pyrophosphatase (non-canonical NTP hydrolase)